MICYGNEGPYTNLSTICQRLFSAHPNVKIWRLWAHATSEATELKISWVHGEIHENFKGLERKIYNHDFVLINGIVFDEVVFNIILAICTSLS